MNPTAYNAYLKGLGYKSKGLPEDIQTAIDYFEEAATLSPEFLPAWRELMNAQMEATSLTIALDSSRTAYDKIEQWLTIAQPHHPEAQLFKFVGGAMRALNHYQWESGIAAMEEALPYLQNDSLALSLTAELYLMLERPQRAYELAARASELDPYSQRALWTLAALHSLSGRSEELQSLLEMDGTKYHGAIRQAAHYAVQGKEEETIKALSIAKKFVPDSHTAIRTIESGYQWQFGDREKAGKIVKKLVDGRWEQPFNWIWVCSLGGCEGLDDDFIEQRQSSFVYLVYLNRKNPKNKPVLDKLNLSDFPEPSRSWFNPSDVELKEIRDRELKLSREEMQKYVGKYGSRPRQIRISIKNDELFYEMFTWAGPMIATAKNEFSSLNNLYHKLIEFEPSETGDIDLCIWEYRGVKYYGYRQNEIEPDI